MRRKGVCRVLSSVAVVGFSGVGLIDEVESYQRERRLGYQGSL